MYLTGPEHGAFQATLSLDHGRGTLVMQFESGFGMQDGGGTLTLTTDQSHVNAALRQIERALGSPEARLLRGAEAAAGLQVVSVVLP